MERWKSPRVMLIGAMVVFGTIGVFVRNIPLASAEVALYRAVLAATLLAGYFLLSRQKVGLKKLGRELPLLLFSGAAMGFNWILLFEAYKYTTVSAATLSYYFAPVIVTVACPILFREKMGMKQWICFAMSTLGIVLITGIGELSGGGQHLKGIAFGLGAAVLYATVILLNKHIKGVEALDKTAAQMLSATVVLIPYVLLTEKVSALSFTGPSVALLLGMGIVHTGLAYVLYFGSLRKLTAHTAAVFSYIDPVVAVLLSALFLGEKLGLDGILGTLLILGAAVLGEIPDQKIFREG